MTADAEGWGKRAAAVENGEASGRVERAREGGGLLGNDTTSGEASSAQGNLEPQATNS